MWGAYAMAPWTNRAHAGPITIAGRTAVLAPNFTDGSAIHGQVYLRPWEQSGESSFVIQPEASSEWPWTYAVHADLRVQGAGLRLTYRIENTSDGPMPGGIGLHPWWRRPVEVGLRARAVHVHNDDPDSAEVPAVGRFELSIGEPVPRRLDATWLDLEPASVTLRWPSDRLGARMAFSAGGAPVHAAVASPDVPAAVAVEPVTHRPWALERHPTGGPDGIRLLAPGASEELTIALDVERG